MTFETKQGCLLDALESGEVNSILHVVNCRGVMGSGIAKQIKDRFPDTYKAYKDCELRYGLVLGCISISNDNIVNLHAQDNYGRDKRHLNYGALAMSLIKYREILGNNYSMKIGIPMKLGCDRAKGNWGVVREMIEFILKDYNVVYYKL